MRADDLTVLDVARYRLHLRAREATTLPPFLGSTLRGAFGHALKRSVCIMRPRDCAQCLVADQCIYPYLFETLAPPGLPRSGYQQAPHPFILSPPIFYPADVGPIRRSVNPVGQSNRSASPDAGAQRNLHEKTTDVSERRHLVAGDTITFGLILIGRAIDYLPYVLYTVSEMAQQGLGVGRARFELSRAELVVGGDVTHEIYDCVSHRIVDDSPRENLGEIVRTRLATLAHDDTLKLRFLTPTRIRVEGAPQSNPGFNLLARNLLRRVLLLASLHGRSPLEFDSREFIASASQVTTRSNELRWWDLERYSNRQQTKIKIGGFIGEMAFTGEPMAQFLPLVAAGELLHVGSGTSFGLGSYQIVS